LSERADFEASKPSGEAETAFPAPQYGQRAPGAWTPPPGSNTLASPTPRPDRREDVLRGAIFSLAIIPLGVVAWLILWDLGWISSIVAFIAAAGAGRLYFLGSGGTISRRGVWVVLGVTILTLLLSFLGSMLLDAAKFLGGGSPLAMLADAQTWDLLAYNLGTNRELVDGYAGDFALALLFSVLGCFFTLRQLFAQSR
jgi:hypothetical protein